MLDTEIQTKYYNDYQAYMKAKAEIGSQPICFDKCVQDVNGTALSSDEKNCMRECFFKRVSSRDDLALLFTQKSAREVAKAYKDAVV